MWILFAILHSFTHLVQPLVLDFSKLKGLPVMFWLRIFALPLFVPVIISLPLPDNPVFYLALIGTSLIFSYTDVMFANLAAQKGAGLTTRIGPVMIWTVFIIWTALHPDLLDKYLSNPISFGGILLSMALCFYFSQRLRNCITSWSALIKMMPAILLASCGAILGKIAVNAAPLHSGVWYYLFFQTLFTAVFYSFACRKTLFDFGSERQDPDFFSKKMLLVGVAVAISFTLDNAVKYYAIYIVENPAYVTIFRLMCPFWVVMLYKMIGRKEQVDVISGLGIVVSCALLVICTQIL